MDEARPYFNTTTSSFSPHYYPQLSPQQPFDSVNSQDEDLAGPQDRVQLTSVIGSEEVVRGIEHMREEEEEEEMRSEGQSTSQSGKLCSVRGCPTIIDEGDGNKMCLHCRERHRTYASTKRAKRKMEKAALAHVAAAAVALPGADVALLGSAPTKDFSSTNLSASAAKDGESSGTAPVISGTGVSASSMTSNSTWATVSLPELSPSTSRRDTDIGHSSWQKAVDPRIFDDDDTLFQPLNPFLQAPVSSSSTLAHALTPVTRPTKPAPPHPVQYIPQQEEDEENEVLASLSTEPPNSETEVHPVDESQPENELAVRNGSSRMCTVKGCKTIIEASYAYKMCPQCRVRYQKYGTTKRAKWKAEREAFDREMAVLRKKEDSRRKKEGLPPLSKSPEELREWELSILDQALPLPDIETLAKMTLATASTALPGILQGADGASTSESVQAPSSSITPIALAAISPLVAAGVYHNHLTNQDISNAPVASSDPDNIRRGFVHPLLVGHLAPYVEGIVSSASAANKAKRRASSTKVEETAMQDVVTPSEGFTDVSNPGSPRLAYPPSPNLSAPEGEHAPSPVSSSDASQAPETLSILASMPPSASGLTPLPARMCTVSHCHRILPGYYRYKRCEQHRLQNRYHSQLKRVREKEEKGAFIGTSSAGGVSSSSTSSLIPPATMSAGTLSATDVLSPGMVGPSQGEGSSSTLSYDATGSASYDDQTAVGMPESSSSAAMDPLAHTTSSSLTTQAPETPSVTPSLYYRHVGTVSDPIEDAKNLALIMAEEDIMGVYAFREKMRKRLLERKPRRRNSKPKVESQEDLHLQGDSAEMSEVQTSEVEIPRQRKAKVSKKLHPKGPTICFRSGCHNLVHPECNFKSCALCREADKDRRTSARLGPNKVAEMQTDGGPSVQGVLDLESGVISQSSRTSAQWRPIIRPEVGASTHSHNSEMDAEGEFDEDSSDSAFGDDETRMNDEELRTVQPQPQEPPPTQAVPAPAPSSTAEVAPSPSEMTKPPADATRTENPPQPAFGKFRLQPPTLPDPLSYPTAPYYSLMPPQYTPNAENRPLNTVYIPFMPSHVDDSSNNGSQNGIHVFNSSDHPSSSDVGSRTGERSGSGEQSSMVPTDIHTSTSGLAEKASHTPASGSSAALTNAMPTTTPSSLTSGSSAAPQHHPSMLPPSSAASVIGKILAMNPGMPIDAFKEVLAAEGGWTVPNMMGDADKPRGGAETATGAVKGKKKKKKKGKGKEKEVVDVPAPSFVQQGDLPIKQGSRADRSFLKPPASALSTTAMMNQKAPEHWRGEIIFQVKPVDDDQTQTSEKGNARYTPPNHVEQPTYVNTWKSKVAVSTGPTTSSVSVLPRIISQPRESQQTTSKQPTPTSSNPQRASAPSKKPANSSKQASSSNKTPSTPGPPIAGASPYVVPYGSYPYPSNMSSQPYQYPYYPYYYPSYSAYGYPPPFSGNIPSTSQQPPASPPKTTKADPKPSRKRKKKGEAPTTSNSDPVPSASTLEPCCVAAGVDPAHSAHASYPNYPYPPTSYPPPYGYASGSYSSAYMQSSYYYPMSGGAGYPYTYPPPGSAPPTIDTLPLGSDSAPIKSTSKGKEKQGSKEAVPDKGSRKRRKFDSSSLDTYRAQTQQIQETLERNAQIGLEASSPKQSTATITAVMNSAASAEPTIHVQPSPASPLHDDNSNEMEEDAASAQDTAQPSTAAANTSTPRKCGYPSCRRTLPSDVHKMLCDRCQIRIKKQTERTKQRHKLQPRKSLNLLAKKREFPGTGDGAGPQ